jgi:hypothetical protein
MKHPGESFSYRVSEDGHTMIFSTDTELSPTDFIKDRDNSAFFSNVDCIILDTQYTLGEAIEKYDWGHTSYSLAVDFAVDWGIKNSSSFTMSPCMMIRRCLTSRNPRAGMQGISNTRMSKYCLLRKGSSSIYKVNRKVVWRM